MALTSAALIYVALPSVVQNARCRDLSVSLTSFENADLGEAIFGEIKLIGVVLLGANFKDAYLYEVDLSEAVYREADLEGAITKQGRN